MGAPREVARSGQTGRGGKVTMRMRTTLLINTSCFTHTDPLPVTHVLRVCARNFGLLKAAVLKAAVIKAAVTLRMTVVLIQKLWNHFCLISFPYCAGMWYDVSETEVSVTFPRHAYPLLATSYSTPIVVPLRFLL
jgi:hypothetical protein